ncbi:hypothetical protein GCM10009677_50080 [Sphaerisporangium rubeum]|uniref:Uncharacterized protein n=1 Tax=Sphaerisporangium rubeum TaxID=321317 RepID=A0A7X0IGV0_9ACTN|nr:hypothetical protein [Sphaerisporangium rubeum]MBB6474974.1 hypothetical protein [Sphaerisporangium rubeum]
MGEYHYYEFLALDHPLTPGRLAEVRALSATAEAGPTGFTDHYESGDFAGDPRAMMERHYDAHIYLSDYGTRQLMLRVPQKLLPLDTAHPYLLDEQVEAWVSGDHLLLDLRSEDEDADWDEADEHLLHPLSALRDELASGDLRPLYIAWLAAVGTWERDEDAFDDDFESELEPPVPAGLATPTPAQQTLAAFLRLDPDLLITAATLSPTLPTPLAVDPDRIATLPGPDKTSLLLRTAAGEAPEVRLELLHHATVVPSPSPGTRTVGTLLDEAAVTRQRD